MCAHGVHEVTGHVDSREGAIAAPACPAIVDLALEGLPDENRTSHTEEQSFVLDASWPPWGSASIHATAELVAPNPVALEDWIGRETLQLARLIRIRRIRRRSRDTPRAIHRFALCIGIDIAQQRSCAGLRECAVRESTRRAYPEGEKRTRDPRLDVEPAATKPSGCGRSSRHTCSCVLVEAGEDHAAWRDNEDGKCK